VLAEVPGVFAGLLGLHVGAGARGNAEIPKLGPISHLSR
jgi:hypothetical protein